MFNFQKALAARHSPDFNSVLKAEIENLSAASLPLQQGMSQSSYVSGDDFSVMINRVVEDEELIRVITGVFYRGVIAGCNCSDDPTPVDTQAEYCELEFLIDKATGEAQVRLMTD